MGVLRPLPVTVTNWTGGTDWIDADEWPHDVPKEGSRQVPFTGDLLIDREDFAEVPPKGWRRVTPGGEVRLRHGYLLTVNTVHKDADGNVTGLEGTVAPESRGGRSPDGRKVKGTVHWVSASEGVRTTVRLVDRLFSMDKPEEHPDGYLAALNPAALVVLDGAVVEPSVAEAPAGSRFQLERVGYFHVDEVAEGTALTRIVPRKDSWGKAAVATPEPKVEAKTIAEPERKRTRKSASDALQELLDERPELAGRIDALVAAGVAEDSATVIGTDDALHRLYTEGTAAGAATEGLAPWLVNDVRGHLKDAPDAPLTGAHLATLLRLVAAGDLTSKVARQVLGTVVQTGEDPEHIVDRDGLRPVRDPEALKAALQDVIDANADKVAAYRGGKTNLRGFFVGQVMRATGGRADPKVLQQIIDEVL